MSGHDIIVIGASAGGIEALTRLFSRLPADLPAAVFVVVHIPAHVTSVLPRIFSRSGPLPAVHPTSGELFGPGTIYVAPPDRHMLVRAGAVYLTPGPKENGHRPGVDPLFRSAALAYGPRVVGVVLSGSLDDGSVGLAAVKQRGGMAVVQSPEEALYASMPRNAMQAVAVDHVLPVAEIAGLLATLAADDVSNVKQGNVAAPQDVAVGYDALDPGVRHEAEHPGTPSGFGCPDCGGALWELVGQEPMRFRCRVGHAWTAHSLMAEQADATEKALWTALRSLEERAALCRRLGERFVKSGNTISAERYRAQAAEYLRSAEVMRNLIVAARPVAIDPTPSPTEENSGAANPITEQN